MWIGPQAKPPPLAHDSRLGWSQQVTHLRKPLGEENVNPKMLSFSSVLINDCVWAGLSQVPKIPKYCFSPCGTLPP
jgi:hypothetical protein